MQQVEEEAWDFLSWRSGGEEELETHIQQTPKGAGAAMGGPSFKELGGGDGIEAIQGFEVRKIAPDIFLFYLQDRLL